uniref:Immunoglobulin V-set domain-containing protein n=1 Tax=Astyanax mexicanus TaxID=7994 RepID=A0A8B9HHX4_ASTMX
MTGFFSLTVLVLTLCEYTCGSASGSFISQLESTVRVQPGLSTSLECHVDQAAGSFTIFWIKIPLNKSAACVATAQTFVDVEMCDEFKNHSRIKVSWNRKTFNLTFSSVEPTDVAIYMFSYIYFDFNLILFQYCFLCVQRSSDYFYFSLRMTYNCLLKIQKNI